MVFGFLDGFSSAWAIWPLPPHRSLASSPESHPARRRVEPSDQRRLGLDLFGEDPFGPSYDGL